MSFIIYRIWTSPIEKTEDGSDITEKIVQCISIGEHKITHLQAMD